MRYCVPIVTRRQLNYLIDADSQAEARDLALREYENGSDGCIETGSEWEKIERVGEIELVESPFDSVESA